MHPFLLHRNPFAAASSQFSEKDRQHPGISQSVRCRLRNPHIKTEIPGLKTGDLFMLCTAALFMQQENAVRAEIMCVLLSIYSFVPQEPQKSAPLSFFAPHRPQNFTPAAGCAGAAGIRDAS